MHILILPSFYPDSININLGSFFREQVKTLAESGIKVNVVYVEQKSLLQLNFRNLQKNHFQPSINDETLWREYRIRGWHLPGRIGIRIWLNLTASLFKKYIKENGRPDLIHVHNVFWAGVAANNLFKKYRIPYVITEHSSEFLFDLKSHYKNINAKQVFSFASGIIAVSNILRKNILEIQPGLEINIVPNVVDTDFFKPGKTHNGDAETINFFAIGYLHKHKRHDLLIDAFFEVLKLNQHAHLKICGEGPEKTKLYKQIVDLGLENNVELIGHQNKIQLLSRLQESDCLIHTSNFETFGVVLIEALSCGVPIIVTKCGGPEDIYEEGVGYMIEPNNVKLLTETMLKFIYDKSKFSKSSIRSVALNKYSPQVIAKQISEEYRKVLFLDQ